MLLLRDVRHVAHPPNFKQQVEHLITYLIFTLWRSCLYVLVGNSKLNKYDWGAVLWRFWRVLDMKKRSTLETVIFSALGPVQIFTQVRK